MQEQESAMRERINNIVNVVNNKELYDRYEDDAFVNFCLDVAVESIAGQELVVSTTFDDETITNMIDIIVVAIAVAHRKLYDKPIVL